MFFFFLYICQLLVVECLHQVLITLKLIDTSGHSSSDYRIHYYLYMFRQLQLALMMFGIAKSLKGGTNTTDGLNRQESGRNAGQSMVKKQRS